MGRIEIKPGLVVVAQGVVCKVVEIISNEKICLIANQGGRKFFASIDELEFLPAIGDGGIALTTPRQDEAIVEASGEEILLAAERYDVIARYNQGELSLEDSTRLLGLSRAALYKLRARFSQELGPVSLVRYKRGVKRNSHRLDEAIEQQIKNSIDEVYSGASASIAAVWRDVEAKCIVSGLPVPSFSAVRARVKSRPEKDMLRKKMGADAASQKYDARPGKKITSRPLEHVQMDHTLVDVIVVDEVDRKALGRPWLTVIIDLYTRIILGYYLSLHHPSTVSVACAITNAVLPKQSFMSALNIDPELYPYYGAPEVIHMDNAKEFRSVKFESACRRNRITPLWRPLGRKHYGGHVERIIGTFMTDKVHFLPGATFSNVLKRRGYNSEKNSALTFKEFCKWFAKEVLIYHGRKHAALGCSPTKKWNDFFNFHKDGSRQSMITNPFGFKLDFMPETTRRIGREGVKFNGILYWNPSLRSHVGTKSCVIKYDPFSMKTIWIRIDRDYIPLSFSDTTREDFSLAEYQAIKKQCRDNEYVPWGGLEDPNMASLVLENKELVKNSQQETKRRRKANSARTEYLDANAQESISREEYDVEEVGARPDYSQRATPFKGRKYD